MSLILSSVFDAVKSDFCSLVDFRMRGDTIEIMTSIPTLTNSYVSVFVSHKNGIFAVSDGGWIYKNMYESKEVEDSEIYDRILWQFKEHFKIKETKSSEGVLFHYKTTSDLKLVSALVFDVGYFVSSVVNTQNLSFKEKQMDDRKAFHNQMNGFLKERFGHSMVDINEQVKVSEKYTIRFNAVVRPKAMYSYFIMYVTGSRSSFFIKDISEATINFEIINDFSKAKEYFKKVAIINTSATGYDEGKSGVYINRLGEALGRPPIFIRNDNDVYRIAEALTP